MTGHLSIFSFSAVYLLASGCRSPGSRLSSPIASAGSCAEVAHGVQAERNILAKSKHVYLFLPASSYIRQLERRTP